ncbi:hypothetical protein [Mesorhizobium carmichaelinearum]|nr:hypothetical protein [Mesorhizobium carmichaelinearum]
MTDERAFGRMIAINLQQSWRKPYFNHIGLKFRHLLHLGGG